jgi:tRNA threonylcarbamoyladenosine dehydratase
MKDYFQRSALLLGPDGMDKLRDSTVAVFGIGGVGSFAVEGIVRTGIGRIVLIDYDTIDVTNINRQIHATENTVGMYKVDAMKDRILSINPNIDIKIYKKKYNKETREELLSGEYDYVVDAVDMISSKIDLTMQCKERDINIISSMGAGNKLNPTMFRVADIYDTKICPLAKVMRKELRRRKVDSLKVVYSEEFPLLINLESGDLRKAIPGSVSFVPSVAGFIIASEVVKDIVLGGV